MHDAPALSAKQSGPRVVIVSPGLASCTIFAEHRCIEVKSVAVCINDPSRERSYAMEIAYRRRLKLASFLPLHRFCIAHCKSCEYNVMSSNGHPSFGVSWHRWLWPPDVRALTLVLMADALVGSGSDSRLLLEDTKTSLAECGHIDRPRLPNTSHTFNEPKQKTSSRREPRENKTKWA